MELSKRLQTIISLVTPGFRAADVGCDHGYVPIRLVSEGISPSAVAADVREGPLSRAKDHIREAGLEDRIETRLSDGLEKLSPCEAETLIMSGIGGMLMIRLLREQRETAHSFRELILSPQSDLGQVRRFLKEDGYTIHQETVLKEDGKYYFIFYVTPDWDKRDWEPEEYEYGKDYASGCRGIAREFLEGRLARQEEIINRLRECLPAGDDRLREPDRTMQMIKKRLQAV